MKLIELFQPGKENWKWAFRNSEEAYAEFVVGDLPYRFHAYTDDPGSGEWEVEFAIDKGQIPPEKRKQLTAFGITGTGNAATVMTTVTDILRSFLQHYNNKITELQFSAAEPSRQALYKRMLKRLLPAWKVIEYADGHGLQLHVSPPRATNKETPQ